jgi:hypothetical protein
VLLGTGAFWRPVVRMQMPIARSASRGTSLA